MQELLSTLRCGGRLAARGEPWLVVDVDPFERVWLVTLRGVGAFNAGEITRILVPFDRLTPLERRGRMRARARHAVLRSALRAIAAVAPWTRCWTAAAARIDVRAWQLEPAHAVLAGATRLLLADEVGLGKTIQALLIAAELSARGLARRILILTPAPLREQWAGELASRFARQASVFDHEALAALAVTLPAGVNPWDTSPLIITSIDLAKRAEVRQALDGTSFDLVIVDEAHHLTPGSDRAALVADLATRTPFVVLATATPHSGDGEAFRFLCGLGDVPGSEPIRVFRRRTRDVRSRRSRRERTVPVAPSDAERALLDVALSYASAVWREDAGGRLAALVIARRVCSSAAAAGATIARRLALLAGADTPRDDQPRLPWEEDSPDAGVPDAVLATPGLANHASEAQWLERLRELAAAASARSSKLLSLRRLVSRTRDNVLVFSEYRDVVEWCAAGLADLAPVAVLHGGLSPSERCHVTTRFNEGRVRLLIATDAAGEGLNLHDRCRLVVNLELPWSPLRLDQRAGRVDRIGQTRRVHIRHLVHRDSYEDRVWARLNERRRTADGDLADTLVGDEAVAACVLGGVALPDAARPTSATLLSDRAAGDAIRHMRLHAPTGSTRDARGLVASRAGSGVSRALLLLYGFEITDTDGRLVQHEVLVLRLELAEARHRLTLSLVREVQTRDAVQAAVRDAIDVRTTGVRQSLAPVALRLGGRLDALCRAVEVRACGTPVQASLFDRREEQSVRARRAVVSRWHEHLRDRQSRIRSLGGLTAGSPQLIAAWLSE